VSRIVGASNSAGQAAVHLAKHADAVTLLVRGESLRASMSEYLITELLETSNVHVRLGWSCSTPMARITCRRSSSAIAQPGLTSES